MNHSKLMLKLFLAIAVGLFGILGAGAAQAQPVCQNTNNASAQDDVCANEGDADGEANQEGNASSGDGVAGQVAGVVSAGDASVDATNRSDDVDVETGSATGLNESSPVAEAGVFVGAQGACNNLLNNLGGTGADQGNACHNSGDADASSEQSADASSGDGVGGQVIGVVTSAGGSADLVLANTSEDAEAESGEAEFFNDDESFTGLNASGVILIF